MRIVSLEDYHFPNQKFLTRAELEKLGFSHYTINKSINRGWLKKVNNAVYENLNYDGDEHDFVIASGYVQHGVICLQSAAFYHGLSTHRLQHIDVALRQKDRVHKLPSWPKVKLFYFSTNRYELGIETIPFEGGPVKIYSLEKTVCDMISYRNKFGLEDSIGVLKNYLNSDGCDLNKLLFFAEKLRLKRIISQYLEVLL